MDNAVFSLCAKEGLMPDYGRAKVYSDGNHFIAIPHTTRPKKPRKIKPEPLITVDENNKVVEEKEEVSELVLPSGRVLTEVKLVGNELVPVKKKVSRGKKVSRKEIFEKLYAETSNKTRAERKRFILEQMKGLFKDEETAKDYVELNIQRKIRNLISRRIRLCRKAYLNDMNYFCTFTYDDKLHTEESFRKTLLKTLSNFKTRYGWEYIGVWERGKATNRLHFHGLFHIPEGQLRGDLEMVEDYDYKTHQKTVKYQNVYFLYTFGRNDFKEIPNKSLISESLSYLIKYLEKSGERIVSSKGLSQYILCDILDEDIVCPIGQDDQKLLLFDDFTCIDEGEIIGKVSPAVIKQMPKAN